jgi:hypothetical protein
MARESINKLTADRITKNIKAPRPRASLPSRAATKTPEGIRAGGTFLLLVPGSKCRIAGHLNLAWQGFVLQGSERVINPNYGEAPTSYTFPCDYASNFAGIIKLVEKLRAIDYKGKKGNKKENDIQERTPSFSAHRR